MRTLTTNETNALAAPMRRFHLRCQIKDSGGTWRDTSNLNGWQWLASAEVNEDVDAVTAEATITLRKGGPGKDTYLSLAPGMENSPLNVLTGSYNPLVALFREVKLELAILPQDVTPQFSDWKLWFHGRIDSYDSAGEEVTVEARDLGGYLVDAFIEVEREYCATPTAVETLIQQILTDNITSVTVPTLRTIGSPSWTITKYKQERLAVMEACQTVAQQNGWQLRYAFDSSDNTFKLTYSQPNRTATVGVMTLTTADYWAVSRVAQHVGGIRNIVQVWYFDAADTDNAGKPKRKSVSSAADAAQTASIAKYGRRWMQLVEDESSLIDSASEAQTYADAIKADLCEPLVELEVEARLQPHVELGDMVTFKANGAHFTSDQTLAVVGFTHVIGPMDEDGQCPERTTLRLRGKPVAKWMGWLALDAGRAPETESAPYLPPPAIATPTVTPTIAGATINYVPPNDLRREWVETELHLSLSSGYTPSSSTLKARTATDSFAVTDLTPGLTYYGRLIGIDAHNNASTASPEFTVVPKYLTAGMVNPQDQDLGWPLNGNFGSWSNGTGQTPDHWEMFAGIWGTGVQSSTGSYSGGYALKFMPNTTCDIRSSLWAAVGGTRYEMTYMLKTGVTSINTGKAYIGIAWYDASGVYISDTSNYHEWATHVVDMYWSPLGLTAVAPTNARFGRCLISHPQTAGESSSFYVDKIQIKEFRAVMSDDVDLSSFLTNGWTTVGHSSYPGYLRAVDRSDGIILVSGLLYPPSVANVQAMYIDSSTYGAITDRFSIHAFSSDMIGVQHDPYASDAVIGFAPVTFTGATLRITPPQWNVQRYVEFSSLLLRNYLASAYNGGHQLSNL